VFILDSLLVNGLKFVLDKVALAADTERDDDTALREELLQAQTRLEAGELGEAEYAAIERDVFAELNAIRRRRPDGAPVAGAYKVTGADVEIRDESD
jgi:hypothetical protein